MLKKSLNQEAFNLKSLIDYNKNSPFVYLESAGNDSENKKSLFFDKFVDFLILNPGDDVDNFFRRLDNYQKKGFYLAGFFSYELGLFLEPALESFCIKGGDFPLAWFGVCRKPAIFSKSNCFKLKEADISDYKISCFKTNICKKEYNESISKIKRYIEKGSTYQVNYTFKYKFSFSGDILSLYSNLRCAQPTSYMAFINTGKGSIISFSPELFFRIKKGRILTRPMKGTVARGYLLKDDEAKKNWLKGSSKNRAENLMIVDLLRNDMGKISKTGSVKVKNLFKVEKYPTLYQMTSTISSLLKKNISYKDIFSALFPSGSVTGAPKISTMKIISSLEKEPRNIYTGAIGYISPCNEACFNVAIRTILIRGANGELGIGGGVVYDSNKNQEFEEAKLKALFLRSKAASFALIETILFQNKSGYYLLDLHIKRLQRSADYFKVPFDLDGCRKKLKFYEKVFKGKDCIVRVLVELNGKIKINHKKIDLFPASLKVKISTRRIDPGSIFQYHKSTQRGFYDTERDEALKEGFHEVIFLNNRGEVAEGAITNIFIKINKNIYTPPLKSGALPGVLREHLLETGKVKEKLIRVSDLKKADQVYVGNSVRGLIKVKVIFSR